jgi:hypothetical protein
MLSLISLGRTLWQKFQTAHPVIRWGGALLVGLVALELIAQEAINLYAHLATVRQEVAAKNAEYAAQYGTVKSVERRIEATIPKNVVPMETSQSAPDMARILIGIVARLAASVIFAALVLAATKGAGAWKVSAVAASGALIAIVVIDTVIGKADAWNILETAIFMAITTIILWLIEQRRKVRAYQP